MIPLRAGLTRKSGGGRPLKTPSKQLIRDRVKYKESLVLWRSKRVGAVVMLILIMHSAPRKTLAADSPWKSLAANPEAWYRGPEGVRIAANILSFQSDQGSWPKNIDTTIQAYAGDRRRLQGTFDNGATFGELRFLARAYQATRNDLYRNAFLKGLDHVLKARYPTGGWPQLYPPGKGYHRHITFNDGAMVNILQFLCDVSSVADFSFVDQARQTAARRGFDSGIQCILKSQIKVNGVLTIWCAQHDEKTLEPRWGRSFEPPALTSAESAGIVRLLMNLDNPGPDIKAAIHGAARWFESAAIKGIRQVTRNGDKVIEANTNAPPLWARFYEIGSNRPIFCGRDGVIRYDLSHIEPERRNGYAWYGGWGTDVATRYARWKAKWDPSHQESP
jgi:PelA/Pel-15E family pectate lyase